MRSHAPFSPNWLYNPSEMTTHTAGSEKVTTYTAGSEMKELDSRGERRSDMPDLHDA